MMEPLCVKKNVYIFEIPDFILNFSRYPVPLSFNEVESKKRDYINLENPESKLYEPDL
jgi:hypothetical protein